MKLRQINEDNGGYRGYFLLDKITHRTHPVKFSSLVQELHDPRNGREYQEAEMMAQPPSELGWQIELADVNR